MDQEQYLLRTRITYVFAWIAGGGAGLILNYAFKAMVGRAYPLRVATFCFFVAGALIATKSLDHFRPRAFAVSGIAMGVVIAVALLVFVGRYLVGP